MKQMMRWVSWIADTAITYNVYNNGLDRKNVALSVRLKCWLDAKNGDRLVATSSMPEAFGHCFSFYPLYGV
jgi:hypothetical protein